MIFELERERLRVQQREAELNREEAREAREQKFQLINSLVSAVIGAVGAAVIAWIFGK